MSCQLSIFAHFQDISTVKEYLFPCLKEEGKQQDENKGNDAWTEDWGTWNDDEQMQEEDSESSDSNDDTKHNWLQDCLVSISPANDLMAVAYGDKLVLLSQKWDPGDKDVETKFSIMFKESVKQDEGETITSILCLPLASQKRSTQGAPDWTCTIVGFSSGYIRIYTETGTLLLSQLLHTEPVQKIKCRTYEPPRYLGLAEQHEELVILFRKALVTVDGFSLYQSLRACRNQVARATAGDMSIHPPPLAYKKWGLQGQEKIQDCCTCGVDTPNPFDQMKSAAMIGPNVPVRPAPPTSAKYVTSGVSHYVGVYNAVEDGRLAINDQLLEVNGESLKDLSNSESMETLRKAMQKEGVIPGNVSSPEVSSIKPLRSAPTVQELLGRSSRNSVLIEDDSLSNEPQAMGNLYWSWLPGLPKKVRWPVKVIDWQPYSKMVTVFCRSDDAYFEIGREQLIPFLPEKMDSISNKSIGLLKKRPKTLKAFQEDLEWMIKSLEATDASLPKDVQPSSTTPLTSYPITELPTDSVQPTSVTPLMLDPITELPTDPVQPTSVTPLMLDPITELPTDPVQPTTVTPLELTSDPITERHTDSVQPTAATPLLSDPIIELPTDPVQPTTVTPLALSSDPITELPTDSVQLTSVTPQSSNQITELPTDYVQPTTVTPLALSSDPISELHTDSVQLTLVTPLTSNQITELPTDYVQPTTVTPLTENSIQAAVGPTFNEFYISPLEIIENIDDFEIYSDELDEKFSSFESDIDDSGDPSYIVSDSVSDSDSDSASVIYELPGLSKTDMIENTESDKEEEKVNSTDKDIDKEESSSDLSEPEILRSTDNKNIFVRRVLKSSVKKTKQKKKGLSVYNSYHACFYCGLLVQHVGPHLEKKHNIKDLKNLRQKGDHKHNQKVIESGKGELLLSRRPKKTFKSDDYGPCPVCMEWLLKSTLQRHQKSCIGVQGDEDRNSKRTLIMKSDIISGRSYAQSEGSKQLREEVFSKMKNDIVSKVAQNDFLIVQLAESCLKRSFDNKLKRASYVSERMRLSAKMLLELRNLENSENEENQKSMWDYLTPTSFDNLAQAAINVSLPQMDDTEDLKSPSNAIKLKYDIVRMIDIKWASLVKSSDHEDEKQQKGCKALMNMLHLFKVQWGEKVTKLARTVLVQRSFQKVTNIPSPEDIKKLNDHVKQELKMLKNVESSPEYFKKAVTLVQTRLLLYNKRRSGEIDAISLKDYANMRTQLNDVDKCLVGDLTALEKHLMTSQDLMIVRGKRCRPVPVIIPEDVKQPLVKIADQQFRKESQIRRSNKHLFASCGDGPIRCYDSLKSVCDCINLINPDRITSVTLRKYTATLSQGSTQPILSEVAFAVASKLKSALMSAASGWLGFGQKQKEEDKVKPKIEPVTPLNMSFGIPDRPRQGDSIHLSPNNNYAATTDNFGRVIIIDIDKGTAIRMWKGYRDAQLGWVQVKEDSHHGETPQHRRVAQFLIIYAPRRGILEVWTAGNGPRIAAFNVGKSCQLICPGYGYLGLNNVTSRGVKTRSFQCALIDPTGTIKTLEVPFHLALSDKNSKRARDLHLLKQLKLALKDNTEESETLEKTLKSLILDMKISSIAQQGLDRVLSTKYLSVDSMRRILKECLKKFTDKESLDGKMFVRYSELKDGLLQTYQLLQESHNKNAVQSDIGSSEELLEKSLNLCNSEATHIVSQLDHYCNSKNGNGNVEKSAKRVKFDDDKDGMTAANFIGCFQCNTHYMEHETGQHGSYDLLHNLSEEKRSDLVKFLFETSLSSSESASDLGNILQSSSLSPKLLMGLLVYYWLSCEEPSVSSLPALYHVVKVVTQLTDKAHVLVDCDNISPWWQKIRDTCSHSNNALASYLLSIACRSVAKEIEYNQINAKDPDADTSSTDQLTQCDSVDLKRWDQLVKQLEDVLSLCSLLGLKKADDVSQPIPVSVTKLMEGGRGSISEIVAKYIAKTGLHPSDIVRFGCVSDSSMEVDPGIEVTDNVTTLDKIQGYLQTLQHRFVHSLENDVLYANASWENAVFWYNDPELVQNFKISTEYLKIVQNAVLRHGVGALMWSMFISKRFQSAALLMEKVAKPPKDRLTRKEVGISEGKMVDFLEAVTEFLDILMEANCEANEVPVFNIEPLWQDIRGPTSLVELAVEQKTTNYGLIRHHYHLSLIMQAVLTFNMKSVKVISLFDSKGKNSFFKAFDEHPLLPTQNVDAMITNNRKEFLSKVITCAVHASDRMVTENLSPFKGSGPVISKPGLNWCKLVIELSKDFGLDVDFFKRHHVIELYSCGHDREAEEVLVTVNDRESIGAEMLPIAGCRVAYQVLVKNKAWGAELLTNVSPSLSTWLKVLKPEKLFQPDVDVQNIANLLQHVANCLPEGFTDYDLAISLVDLVQSMKQ